MSLLELRNISKSFVGNGYRVNAVKNFSMSLEQGESMAIIGPSGSGKSTVLNMAGLILQPDAGEVLLNGKAAESLNDARRCALRNANYGFVTQDYALLEDDSVYNNIRLPLLYHKTIPRKEHKERILCASCSLGVEDKLRRPVNKLSGGERQRVSIARALVCDQPILLADEPTGALDQSNKEMVMDHLFKLVREQGVALLIVTHDLSIAERCDQVIELVSGSIMNEGDRIRNTIG